MKSNKRKREENPDQQYLDLANELFQKQFQERNIKSNNVQVRNKTLKAPSIKLRRTCYLQPSKNTSCHVADDTVVIIFMFTPISDLLSIARLVCHDWNNMINNYLEAIIKTQTSIALKIGPFHKRIPDNVKTGPGWIINKATNLKSISITNGDVLQEDLILLINKSARLESLRLSYFDTIDTIDTSIFVTALSGLLHLRHLYLEGRVTSRIAATMVKESPDILGRLVSLSLKHTSNTHIGDIMDKCNNLFWLDVSETPFDDDDMAALIATCGNTLEVLNLSSCYNVTGNSLTSLGASCPRMINKKQWNLATSVSVLPSTITHLSLRRNLCFKSMSALHDALTRSPCISNLVEMDLMGALPKGKDQLKYIRKILLKSKNLKRLLVDNGIYDRVENDGTKKIAKWRNIDNSNDEITIYV
ncbi:hypothetical protein AKO1_012423 [Acrasis kona]|uniref:F-box domain-containing protein n=1 Tax=Acrasis kona TaxID=1008807 RepID=A0AAW2YXY6_9EUKA